jgi:hypothetical protein
MGSYLKKISISKKGLEACLRGRTPGSQAQSSEFKPQDCPPKKINKETSELKFSIDQMDQTDIYKILHPTAAEYPFFSAAS